MSETLFDRSVVLVGGHDTGKSVYVGRLWLALRRSNGRLAMPNDPEQIEYVEALIRDLEQGRYPERTDNDGQPRTFEGRAVVSGANAENKSVRIVVPDVAGELWERASEEREFDESWLKRLRRCAGALLFTRSGSAHHVEALDWITAADKMAHPVAQLVQTDKVATQLFLTDLLNLLDLHLSADALIRRPRVAIMVTAWDALPADARELGPERFVKLQYPMLGGRLRDRGRIDTRVFATSITGGDLNTVEHRTAFLESSADQEGYVLYKAANGEIVESADLTLPIAWAVGVDVD